MQAMADVGKIEFSIDLVSAALRQREFAKKIISSEHAGINHPLSLSRACSRYHKFILLMNRKNKMNALVPTLDIDLCWHTHQLQGSFYRDWCIEHLGFSVNHDDTVGKEVLTGGLEETTRAWWDAYREPYQNGVSMKGRFSRWNGSIDEQDGILS